MCGSSFLRDWLLPATHSGYIADESACCWKINSQNIKVHTQWAGTQIHQISNNRPRNRGHQNTHFSLYIQIIYIDRFEELHGKPGVVGLVDGTHIKIGKLLKTVEWAYVNRKGFHSINTQIVSFVIKIIQLICNYKHAATFAMLI